MIDWLNNNETMLGWLMAMSLFSFIATLIVIPVILVKIPEDYFLTTDRRPLLRQSRHWFLHALLLMARNILGLYFVLAGLAMLVLPGQGLLTIFIGILLLNFPGKYSIERRIVHQPGILNAINWIRRKAGRGNLVID